MRLLKNFEKAKKNPKGVVVMEGDWGGQIYLTCPMKYVQCDEKSLVELLSEIDFAEWGCNEGDGAYINYFSANPGDGIGGGMGGGVVEDGLWVHPYMQSRTRELIKKVINGGK